VETGIRAGDPVSPYYDPMLAKLVVWGETRHQAMAGEWLDGYRWKTAQHIFQLESRPQSLSWVVQG
jgi:acetyl/propionyl-CoA carboxylase alpha subunit